MQVSNHFVRTIVICVILVLSTALQVNSEYLSNQLLYTIPSENIPNFVQLMQLDIHGNSMAFSSQILNSEQIYISPDQSRVSGWDVEGDLVVLDALGEVTVKFEFSNQPENRLSDWHMWGWHQSNTLILSQILDDRLSFYELDLTEQSLTLNALEHLNNFFVWPVSDLVVSGIINYDEQFQFSSSFQYVITPPLIYGGTLESQSITMIFWDLMEKTASALEPTFPWWYGLDVVPDWANSEDTVIFSLVSTPGINDLYIYDHPSPPILLYQNQCPNETCVLQSYSWSPSDTEIAFWQTNASPSDDTNFSTLILIQLENNLVSTIISDRYSPTKLYWSQNEEYLAFQGDQITDNNRNPEPINILNINTREIILSFESTTWLNPIGWINIR